MDILYKFSKEKEKGVKGILSENPYEEKSISKLGYVLRDGKSIGEGDVVYLYFSVDECHAKFLDEKLSIETIEKVGGEEKERVIKKIKEEEENAAVGFGGLFE